MQWSFVMERVINNSRSATCLERKYGRVGEEGLEG